MEELIIVRQLPVIEETLKTISDEIEKKISFAQGLDVTEDTVKEVKKIRSDLNKDFESLEEKRKEVYNAIISPYKEFEGKYKKYISEKFKQADASLRDKIYAIEDSLKGKKKDTVKAYFEEYREARHLGFVNFEQTGISVNLSDSLKSLKDKCALFLDKISEDIELIRTQENSIDILVEYKNSLNASSAIKTVRDRMKAAEEERIILAKIEETKEAEKQIEQKVESLTAPEEEKYTLRFSVKASLPKLKALKSFLINGGYEYEQERKID